MTKRSRLLLLIPLLLPAVLPAQGLELIELGYRSAEELIPLLQPFVEPGGTLGGSGRNLLLRTSPANSEELKQVVRRLDAAPRALVVSVRQGGHKLRGAGGIGPGEGRVRVYSTRERHEETAIQQVRTIEGQWARIATGQDVPLHDRTVGYGPGGAVVRDSIEYRPVASGFEVRVRVDGERVRMELRPFHNRSEGGGVIATQEVQTVLEGRVGEWIGVAGSDQTSQGNGRGIVYSTRDQDDRTRNVYVKVDVES